MLIPKSYYEIQRVSKLKSILLFLPLFLIYLFTIIVYWIVIKYVLSVIKALENVSGPPRPIFGISYKEFFLVLFISVFLAVLHWFFSRILGIEFILSRLNAKKPDLSDRYHKIFIDVIDEMQIATGLPKTECHVIPNWQHNSLALVGKRSKPMIVISEGMISSLNREELQGVVAHEMAHILRGDSVLMGISASLINIVYQMAVFIKPESIDDLNEPIDGPQALIVFFQLSSILNIFLLFVADLFMRFFSCFISRERELLADATAVEMTRNPFALAHALYQSRLIGTDLGDRVEGYASLFIMAPKPGGVDSKSGLWGRLFSTHPPLEKRLFYLLTMAHRSFKELQAVQKKSKPMYAPAEMANAVKTDDKDENQWSVMNQFGKWTEPATMKETVNLSWFNLSRTIRLAKGNPGATVIPESVLRSGIKARHVKPFVELFMKRIQKSDFEKDSLNCPSCGTELDHTHYEGVLIRSCKTCGGNLAREGTVFRILTREELDFPERFRNQVRAWREKLTGTSLFGRRFRSEYWCPQCGLSMRRMPYTWAYPVIVDRCPRCESVWFDRHELEALQVLVEESRPAKTKTV
jgi:Zn-dependent protease with chaperone function/Zn-finger nucleic acid-binding protein